MAKKTGELHLLFVKNWFSGYLDETKISSDGPSYGVGGGSRTRLKGSLASPTSIPRKGTSNLYFYPPELTHHILCFLSPNLMLIGPPSEKEVRALRANLLIV